MTEVKDEEMRRIVVCDNCGTDIGEITGVPRLKRFDAGRDIYGQHEKDCTGTKRIIPQSFPWAVVVRETPAKKDRGEHTVGEIDT